MRPVAWYFCAVPDRRQHRGAHPQDPKDFAAEQLPALREATHDYSWLIGRGYTPDASLKLVGDRFQLRARQRTVVARCAGDELAIARRRSKKRSLSDLHGKRLGIDGFNALITLEVAMSRGPLFIGCDSAFRDVASVHGTYRKVVETAPAVQALCQLLRDVGPAHVRWLFDRPVSNSGRVRALVEEAAAEYRLPATVELHADVDREVLRDVDVVASSDSWVIDHAAGWVDLPAAWIEPRRSSLWVSDLRLAASDAS